MGCIQDASASGGRRAVSAPLKPGEFARRKSQFENPPKSLNSSTSLRRQSSANVSDGGGGVSIVLSGGNVLNSPTLAQPTPRKPKDGAGLAQPANNRRQSESANSNTNRRKSEAAQRKFSTVQQICKRCEEPILGKVDEAKDSKGVVFHKTCLKCTTCGISLADRECVQNAKLKMSSQQYMWSGEDVYCDRHNPVAELARRKNSVKGQDITERAVDASELKQIGSSRRDLNEIAKGVLEDSVVMSNEMVCGRCGYAIEKSQKMLVSGMQRFHETCPSKAELEAADKSIKFFLQKLPDRLACVLTCDATTRKPNTFLYVLDKESLKTAAKTASASSSCEILFHPDSQQHSKAKFDVPQQREFDLQVKAYPPPPCPPFSFENVRTPDVKFSPQLQGIQLKVTKQTLTNGVIQTVEATFRYDESIPEDALVPDRIVLRLELLVPRKETLRSATSTDSGASRSFRKAESDAPMPSASSSRSLKKYVTADASSSTMRSTSSFNLKKYESASALDEPKVSRTSNLSSTSSHQKPPSLPPSPTSPATPSSNKPPPMPASAKPTTPVARTPPPLPKNKPQINTIDMDMC